MIVVMLKKYALLVLCFLPFFGNTQTSNFNFKSYTTDGGFPTNAWRVVLPDSYGFLWLASFDGLFRWDGYSFRKYTHDESDSASIDNNIIYSVYEDSQKRLWVGTISGLNLYDRQYDQFTKCVLKPDASGVPINTMVEDRKGQLWLGTSEGLCRYDAPSGKSFWFRSGDEADVIWTMAADEQNNIWVGTFNNGLKKFDAAALAGDRIAGSAFTIAALNKEKIRSILVDRSGKIWIGTEDKGAFLLDANGTILRSFNQFSRQIPAAQNSVNCLYQDNRGRIWFGISREVLYYLEPGAQYPVPLEKNTLNNNREQVVAIISIREDEFGNTWFASGSEGLFSTNINKNVFHNFLQDPASSTGMRSRIITCFFEDKDKKIWGGTNGSGIFVFDPVTQQVKRPAQAVLQNKAIRDIKGDKDGTIWITGWGAGVTHYDPVSGVVKQYLHDAKDPCSVAFNDAKVILPDENYVWVGTHGQGLSVLDKRTGCFINQENNNGRFQFELNAPAWINHLFKDSKQRLWISTYSGLFVYDGQNLKQFEHQSDSSSISSNSVNMVTEDAHGVIWIVSEGGLDRYEDKTNSFTRYSKRWTVNSSFKSVVTGSQNTLWVSCNDGILVVETVEGRVKLYDTNDGLPDNSFYQKSVAKLQNGTLLFGCNKGFTMFDPFNMPQLKMPDYFYFTDLSINNDRILPHSETLSKVLAFTDTIRLKRGQSFFSIGFAAVNLYASGKTRYACQMEGLQDEWMDIDEKDNRRIRFMQLQPGTYNLRVRYTGSDGQWRIATKTLTIIILPAWWQTWWFKVLTVLFGIGCIIGVFYARVAAIRKRNRLLKLEVDKRTKELHAMNASLIEQYDEISLQKERLEVSNDENRRQTDKIIEQQQHILEQNQQLENSVKELEKLNSTKDYFFSILAHDLKDPVHALTEMMEFMKDNLRRIDRKELEGYIDNMYDASAAVYELLINLLTWSRSQSKNISATPVSLSLRELIDKNARILHAQLENKHIQLENHISHLLFVCADYDMIDTAVRNILANAIKFTDYNGRVEVNAARNGDKIILRITDTGVGMSPEKIKKLFKLDTTDVTSGTAGEKGIGLGLVISHQFITLNKGTIWVESTPEQGSSFYIQLPAADQESLTTEKVRAEGPLVHSRVQMDFWDTVSVEKLVRLRGRKILIVDDNVQVRNYLKLVLSDTFEVFESANGKDALGKASQNLPSVIISDVLMPDMNGLDFCRTIKGKTETSHIPVVFFTSQWQDDAQVAGYEAGADAYLKKPVKKELLLQVIINLLSNQERLHGNVLETILDDSPIADIGAMSKIDKEFLNQLVNFIEANISNPDLDAKMLSKELATSRTVLYNKIRILTGQTVHEFIKSIRLRKSLKLLIEGNLSINQVAFEVGFNSHSYFDKCFIKQYKMGPKEYVNKKRNSLRKP